MQQAIHQGAPPVSCGRVRDQSRLLVDHNQPVIGIDDGQGDWVWSKCGLGRTRLGPDGYRLQSNQAVFGGPSGAFNLDRTERDPLLDPGSGDVGQAQRDELVEPQPTVLALRHELDLESLGVFARGLAIISQHRDGLTVPRP